MKNKDKQKAFRVDNETSINAFPKKARLSVAITRLMKNDFPGTTMEDLMMAFTGIASGTIAQNEGNYQNYCEMAKRFCDDVNAMMLMSEDDFNERMSQSFLRH